jgi:energy-coupling factor transporter ATP-binding protein EcfA2
MTDDRKQAEIRARALSRVYLVGRSEVHALREIDLDVARGEFLSVVGVSGSGKSTLLHLLGALDTTDSDQFAVRREHRAVRVVGVCRAPGLAARFVRANVLLPVDTMQDLPGTTIERNLNRLRADAELPLDSYPEVTVRAERPAAAFRLEQQIRDMGFEARAVAGRIKEARRVFVFMEVLLAAVGTVGLVVAGLGIMNTLLMSVMERFPLWLLVGAVAYTLLISLLSGVYPASRAARVDPIQALRRG